MDPIVNNYAPNVINICPIVSNMCPIVCNICGIISKFGALCLHYFCRTLPSNGKTYRLQYFDLRRMPLRFDHFEHALLIIAQSAAYP